MRLIDADALIDESLKEDAYGYVDTFQIARAPTVDAFPVVRCKDCIHFWDGICNAHIDVIDVDDNDFCSRGEREDSDWVEVVRCKDCRWGTAVEHEPVQGADIRCQQHNCFANHNSFCSLGERREDAKAD